MKQFNIFIAALLILILGGNTQNAKAQDSNIEWTQYAQPYENVVDQYVYLYNVTNNGFLNAGGNYGMQAVLASRGIRLTLKEVDRGEGNTYYYLDGPITNTSNGKGSCIGVINTNDKDVYIDLAKPSFSSDRTAMTFSRTGENTFRISCYDSRLHYDSENGYLISSSQQQGDEWCLITAEQYREVIQTESAQGRYNVSGLILNSRFIRNVVTQQSEAYWSTEGLSYNESDYCTSIDPHMGTEDSNDTYASNYGAFGCLEIGAVTGKFFQTVSNLRPGLYAVAAQAFFDKYDKSPYTGGAYNRDNSTDESNAYLYANDVPTKIPELTGGEYSTFKNYVDNHYNKELGRADRKYFRRNVPAAYFLAQGDKFTPDETFHRVITYVTVGEDGNLELGVRKDATGGRVYVDNISLYYIGSADEELGFGVDAYGTADAVDTYKYNEPYYFNLSRKFNLGQWSALTLPVDIFGSQVKQTFGEQTELCELTGINLQNPNQILFTSVDLDNTYDAVIKANHCYLIKVSAEAKFNEDSPYTFNRRNEADPKYGEDPEQVTYQHGYIYQFTGVSCPDGIKQTGTGTTEDEKLKYTYFNYHPDHAPAGSYVMSGGDMYHLTGNWSSLIGTAWYIEETNPTQGTKTFVIDNGNGTTDINGIVTETPAEKVAEGVYTINGQKVASDKSLNDLPKGIYIVNGKKYIVR